ncbi:MAG: PorP/SprF family type IX secretion system membrane protein [Bacteroidia bacterium]|nr:PorP/SprF family type IX secretion system membrane protein [Bacteroidia bacterium]
MKTIFKTYVFALIASTAGIVNAQQTSLFNTYALDPLQLNIAYSGAKCGVANLHYRTQWIGMQETPKVFQLNAHSAFGKSHGLGLRINSQNMGLLNQLGATVGYSHRFTLKDSTKLHVGIGLGWSQVTLQSQKSIVIDDDDVTLNNNVAQKANGFDSEFGVMYIGNKLMAGISALHLYNSNPQFSGTSSVKSLPQLNTQVSYVFFKNEKVELEPWLLNRITIKGDNVIEGMLKANFLKHYSAAIGYRANYGLLVTLGARISNINIGYSFDYGANKNAANLGTSHQVMLGFNFCKKAKSPEPEKVAEQPTVTPAPEEIKEVVKTESVVPEEIKQIPEIKEVPKTEPVVEVKPEPVVEIKPEAIKEEPKADMISPEQMRKAAIQQINPIARLIIFSINSNTISPENEVLIKQVAEVMKKSDAKFNLIGYASMEGPPEVNQLLSLRRAEAIRQMLIKNGIAASRLSIKSGGATSSVHEVSEKNRTFRVEE